MSFVALLFFAAQIWLIVGAIVAFVFLAYGIDKIDEDAHASYFFRLLLIPAILMLWPLVLQRWRTLYRTKNKIAFASFQPPRLIHGFFSCLLAATCLTIILLALFIQQPKHIDKLPQQISQLQLGDFS